MPKENVKKGALQAYKDKLITEIYYYDKRISESRTNLENNTPSWETHEASDSDSDIVPLPLTNDPTISDLRSQQATLKTNLMATQELSNLEVLQSEVNILVEPPVVEGEPPVRDSGVWKEIAAECRVGQVPFSITFFAHVSDKESDSISYRGLKVLPVKSTHEAELSKSILPSLKRPSDAIEVLKNYAVAHRSRRSTLARLADKFGDALFMEPVADGGYYLKCANMMEIFWRLENKWSPIAPFHHRLKFDLEYMEEFYVKKIAEAHSQLSDPAVDTDERTLLLAKIISICLDAASRQPDSSDQEPEHNPSDPPRRRTTLDKEPELPTNMKRKKDSEVMAPPTSPPKKIKSKNKIEAKTSKRAIEDDASNAIVKKLRTNEKEQGNSTFEKVKETNQKISKGGAGAATDNKVAKNKLDKGEKGVAQSKSAGDILTVATIFVDNNVIVGDVNKKDEIYSSKNSSAKKIVKTKAATNKKIANTENNNKTEKVRKDDKQNDKENKNDNAKKTSNKGSNIKRRSMTNLQSASKQATTKAKRKSAPITKTNAVVDKNAGNKQNNANKISTPPDEKGAKASEGKAIKIVKNVTNEKGDVVRKVVKKLASDKPKVAEKISAANPQKENIAPRNAANPKVVNSVAVKKSAINTEKFTNQLNEKTNKNNKTTKQNNMKKVPQSLTNTRSLPGSSVIVKKIMSDNIGKENTKKIKTKIPQKSNFMSPKKTIIKKAPIRISPRKPVPKTKSPLAGVNIKKIVQKKTSTGIPRLTSKPAPKDSDRI